MAKVKLTTEEELEKELKEAGIYTEEAEKINFLSFEDDFQTTQFHGTDLDMLFGLLYVFKRHKNGCIPINIKLDRQSSLYFNLGINWTCKRKKRRLYMPKGITHYFKKCLERPDVQFIFILLTLSYPKRCTSRSFGQHANVLIYDKETKTMERFEPNGCSVNFDIWYEIKEFDKIFRKIAKNVFNSTYVTPDTCCPYIGPQAIQESEKLIRIADPEGFCAAWTLWIIELRLKNPKESLKSLQLLAIKKMKKDSKPLTDFIRNFSQYVVKKRGEVLAALPLKTQKKIEQNPSTLEELSDQDLTKVNKVIIKEFKELWTI
jgi:hypothetical protein